MMVFWMLLGGAAGIKIMESIWRFRGIEVGELTIAVPVGGAVGALAGALLGLIKNPRLLVLLMAVFAGASAGGVAGQLPWGDVGQIGGQIAGGLVAGIAWTIWLFIERRKAPKRGEDSLTNELSQMANGIDGGQMKSEIPITTLFLDVGGVLLSNGWDHHARERAATNFELDLAEMDDRHHLTFDTYEEGKLTLEEYLSRTVFYKERPCTRAQFREFMFAQSQPHPEMIELVTQLKARHKLKIAVLSNEAREVNAYRIAKFKLNGFVDFFISSCFVHLRKPNADIFRLALDITQTPAHQVLYIENTPMFVQIAEGLGIRSILHTDYKSTCAKLASFGLHKDEGVSHETS